MKEIEDIGSIIGSVVDGMGINRKLNTSNIFNHWEKIAGKEIAKRSRPRETCKRDSSCICHIIDMGK